MQNTRGSVTDFLASFLSADSNQKQSDCAMRDTLITSPHLLASPIDCLFVEDILESNVPM